MVQPNVGGTDGTAGNAGTATPTPSVTPSPNVTPTHSPNVTPPSSPSVTPTPDITLADNRTSIAPSNAPVASGSGTIPSDNSNVPSSITRTISGRNAPSIGQVLDSGDVTPRASATPLPPTTNSGLPTRRST